MPNLRHHKTTNDTGAVARQLIPTIRIVEQAGKGKGDAIRAGLAASTGDIIMLDADGSADLNEIPYLLKHLWQEMILPKARGLLSLLERRLEVSMQLPGTGTISV